MKHAPRVWSIISLLLQNTCQKLPVSEKLGALFQEITGALSKGPIAAVLTSNSDMKKP